jgi:hypothetical protein
LLAPRKKRARCPALLGSDHDALDFTVNENFQFHKKSIDCFA